MINVKFLNSIISSLFLAFGMVGCAFHDFKVPQKPINAADVQSLIDSAQAYYDAYDEEQDDLANERQIFEIPIIGSAIVAVSAMSFGRHPDAAVASGIVAGSAGAFSTYYAPRQRAQVYLRGMESMLCLKNAAEKVLFLDKTPSPTTGVAAAATGAERFALRIEGVSTDFRSLETKAAGALGRSPTNFAGATLSEIEKFQASQFLVEELQFAADARSLANDISTAARNSLNVIEDGIRQVHLAVVSQLDAAVATPSYGTILGNLRQAIQSSEEVEQKAENLTDKKAEMDVKTGDPAVSEGLSVLSYDMMSIPAPSVASGQKPVPDISILTGPQSMTVADLDSRIKECVALMNPS